MNWIEAYLNLKERKEKEIARAEKQIASALREACFKAEVPKALRPATPKDIVEGAILWRPDGDAAEDEGDGEYYCGNQWIVVEHVLNPKSEFKGFYNDGCRYGYSGWFAEIVE